MPRKRITRLAVAAATVAATALVLSACTKVDETAAPDSTFPEKDLRLIIQANPGGGSDLSSRALATELEDILGVNVIPENMPGAAGALAMEYVAAQPADGYVIGFAPVEIAMLNTTQGADVLPENYDLLGQIMLAPGVVTVGASSVVQTLEDLVAKAEAGSVTVANSGAGSIWEAATVGLAAEVGGTFTPVPYDGGATAVSAAASGETDAAVSGLGEALAQGDAVRSAVGARSLSLLRRAAVQDTVHDEHHHARFDEGGLQRAARAHDPGRRRSALRFRDYGAAADLPGGARRRQLRHRG